LVFLNLVGVSKMQYFHAIVVVLLLIGVVSLFVWCFLYIRLDYYLKAKQKKPLWMSRLPALENMHKAIIKNFYATFFLLCVLMISGVVLAHDVWSDGWITQPKWVFALLTWVYFFVMFVFAFNKGLRGTGFFRWLMVGCFFIGLSLLGAYV